MGTLEIRFLVIVGILIGLKQANAIDCYKCDVHESTCNDPFKTSGAPTVACNGSCLKFKPTESSSNPQVAIRECLKEVAVEKCEAESKFVGITGTLCSCGKNLCNYAFPVGSSLVVMAAATIVCVVFR